MIPTKRILFPTDFSEVAENAFVYALSLAEQIKAEIYVTHIVPILEPEDQDVQVHPFMKTAHLQLEALKLEEFEKEKERLEELVSILHKENIHLEFLFIKGDFTNMIMDLVQSNSINIIVMGTSGANTIDKKLFGSNTMSVINNIDIPVMAIPSNARFTSLRNYSTAVMMESKEIPIIRKIAEYLSLSGSPMNCVNIISSSKAISSSEEIKRKWLKDVDCPNVTVDIVVDKNVDKGLLDYAKDNEIDLLGILHRNLPIAKRLFKTNHSKLLLKHSRVALLIYNNTM